MRTVFVLFTFFLLLLMSCKKVSAPKSQLEIKFEQFISQNNPGGIIIVDSFIVLDSTTIFSQIDKIDSMSKELDSVILDKLNKLASPIYLNTQSKVFKAADIALDYGSISHGAKKEKAENIKEKILTFTDFYDEELCYYVDYKIFIRNDSGETGEYYAQKIGYEDTILFFPDIKERAWTKKSERVGIYLRDYMKEKWASRAVINDEIDKLMGIKQTE